MIRRCSILMINYYFPPIRCVATHRISNFYHQCNKYFNKVYVTTTNRRHLPREDCYERSYPNLKEIGTLDYRLFSKEKTAFNVDKGHGLGKIVFKLVESFPTNFFIGEGGVFYILYGIITGVRMIKRHPIGYLFSSFRPFADHYIAYFLKTIYPQTFWIADFRDHPVNESLHNTYFPHLQSKIIKRLLKKADLITGVSEGIVRKLTNANSHVLRNGISRYPKITASDKFDKFTICYTGSVYPEEQDPAALLIGLKDLMQDGKIEPNNFQFVYAGFHQDYWQSKMNEFGLLEIFQFAGYLPYTDTLELQSRSHLNLLLNYYSDHQAGDLSAKLFEYLRWSTPIMAITNGGEDPEIADIFTSTHCGRYFTADQTDRVRCYLNELIDQWLKGDERPPFRVEERKYLEWEESFAQLVSTLISLNEGKKNSCLSAAYR